MCVFLINVIFIASEFFNLLFVITLNNEFLNCVFTNLGILIFAEIVKKIHYLLMNVIT